MSDNETQNLPWIEVASFTAIDLGQYAILTTKVFDGCRVTIFTKKNKSAAYLLLEENFSSINWDKVYETAKNCKVTIEDDVKAIVPDYIAGKGKMDGKKVALCITRGKDPEHGIDSIIEWHVEEPERTVAGKETEGGSMNYRERKTYVHVDENTHLLTVHPPTKGVPGRDIFGNPIPARDGNWVRPVSGDGTKWGEQQQLTLFSEYEGTIQLIEGKYCVRRVLVVHDVDFKSGNITYNGDVDITGSVQQGFSVTAEGSITVAQDVTTAQLIGQNVIVHGAVTGDSEIVSSGRVQIGRAEGIMIRCDEGVKIMNDTANIRVFCGGRLDIPNKKLSGGTINALGGINVGWLGGKNGSATQVKIDLEQCRMPCLDEAREKLDASTEKFEQLKARLGPLATNQAAMDALPPDRKEAVKKLFKVFNDLSFEIDVNKSAFRKKLTPYTERVSNVVTATHGISEGVGVAFGKVQWDAGEKFEGAHRVTLSRDGESVVCEAM